MLAIPDNGLIGEDRARGLTLQASDRPSDAFIEQLAITRFGNSGLTYLRLDIAEQMARMRDSVFIELQHERQTAGTYVLAARPLRMLEGDCYGIYRGLLTLGPQLRSSGLGRFVVQTTLAWLNRQAQQHDTPLLTWGCIEKENAPSIKLLASEGASPIGHLESFTVFRQWPRRLITTDTVPTTSSESIDDVLRECYADCALQMTGGPAPFFAVTDDSGIVAGARASVTRVNMTSTGSFWDILNDKLLRHVTAARRRFDPRNFTYLRLSDVVVREGHARAWQDLLPTLLAQHEVYMAMFVLDPGSMACRLLESAGLFGRLARSTRQQIDVMANGWNIDAATWSELARRPLAIGPVDI